MFKDGKLVRTLKPERRFFKTGEQQSTTTVALHSTPKEDLYVVFAGMSEDSKAEIAAHVNPLVFWIWFGLGNHGVWRDSNPVAGEKQSAAIVVSRQSLVGSS